MLCPHCGKSITRSDALTGPLRDHLRSELQEESTARLEQETKRIRALDEPTQPTLGGLEDAG